MTPRCGAHVVLVGAARLCPTEEDIARQMLIIINREWPKKKKAK